MRFLTDVHTHSDFSFDGDAPLSAMLSTALERQIAFYGVSEHVDYDLLVTGNKEGRAMLDAEGYFHTARHLQEDYEGCMNVLIGAEFSYIDDENAYAMYENIIKTYHPDFIVNSVHSENGEDYYDRLPFYQINADGERVLLDKTKAYANYFQLVLKSLHVRYPYQIVGHIGYAIRYAPYQDPSWRYQDYQSVLDEILKTVIAKNKILEVNTGGGRSTLPTREILERYYALGGRAVSFASDAHHPTQIMANRAEVSAMLKEIGFTHYTVPCKDEYVRVEI